MTAPTLDLPSVEFRTYTPELEVRAAAQGGDGRTVFGIAVPYDTAMWIDETLIEEFAPGAFNAQLRAATRVAFSREHVELGGFQIGVLTMMRDDTAGLYVEMRASKTALGDETLELIKDGILTDLSVAFYPGKDIQVRSSQGVITRRVLARLDEVASVSRGAYGKHATVMGTRSAQGGAGIPQQRGRMGRPVDRTPNLDAAKMVLAALPELPPLPAQIR